MGRRSPVTLGAEPGNRAHIGDRGEPARRCHQDSRGRQRPNRRICRSLWQRGTFTQVALSPHGCCLDMQVALWPGRSDSNAAQIIVLSDAIASAQPADSGLSGRCSMKWVTETHFFCELSTR